MWLIVVFWQNYSWDDTAKRSMRCKQHKKEKSPQQDAEINIKAKTDKLRLEERFISSVKAELFFYLLLNLDYLLHSWFCGACVHREMF